MCRSRSCCSVTGVRRVDEQVLAALRLRERDHVADRFGAAHQRRDAVEAERDAAVRRRAVGERVEQEAELAPLVLRADAERLEHLRLDLGAVDPHRAAADLPAVQHDVVGLRDRVARIGREALLVAVLRRGERDGAARPSAASRRPARTSGSRPPTAASSGLRRSRDRARPSRAARPARRSRPSRGRRRRTRGRRPSRRCARGSRAAPPRAGTSRSATAGPARSASTRR